MSQNGVTIRGPCWRISTSRETKPSSVTVWSDRGRAPACSTLPTGEQHTYFFHTQTANVGFTWLHPFRTSCTSSCVSFRCVLAASSPVLASILSSTGVLVELQAPCLSDSVLAHVLDYIYTGALPCTQNHQQYSSLFTAACYLKMDELQRSLETQVKHLQLSGSCAWEKAHGGTATSRRSTSERTLQGINPGSRAPITVASPQKLPQAIPATADMCGASRMGTEVQRYQFLSACPANPESWQQSTGMQARPAENKRSSAREGETSIEEAQSHSRDEQSRDAPAGEDGGASPSSPRPSCGAVPVIRHSSAAEARTAPTYHLASKVSESNDGNLAEIPSQSDHGGSPPKPCWVEERTQEPGRVFKHEAVCNREDRRQQHEDFSRCPTDTDEPSSTPSLHITEQNTGGPAFVRREDDDRDKSQPCATSAARVDNTCDPSCSVVEQSYHAHLHYHCLHPQDPLLPHRSSDPKHPLLGLSDRASDEDEDEDALFSSAAQHFTPADQVLLLDISTKPPELLVSYKYDRPGDWGALGQDAPGNQRDGEAAGRVAANGKVGLQDRTAAAQSTEKRSETRGDQGPGAHGESYTLRFTPSCVPDSLQAPTSSFCIPPTISANMPTVISPQLSNHHPFQCSMCHRSFSQRGSLNRHMRSHLGIRPFPCPRCPMTFSRQYRVSEHMRVHQRCVLGNDFQKPRASST